ncbi:F-box/kelch-repeat protein At5g15710 [Physcomitrium patens]|uniref:F-box domain-containing protein n=1 Tax=Physcomitrium patens TaxID=3218 RepID=A0A2K1IF79_PHYPA|nr:F-box/kelch-repeat protein At5g15710-like [Physcomitrium patens]XP_024364627.1 F-box/kelch-repeat protein At5g15710-like [Physcomitrium patens]XP_024364628.1 F-box/kelch-repeat protein At5g15710-like [Physcomitrium patens]XP_024364629.1 F-box/kelch-repeat protein At5g15710-like [Physcomitrium patens]PNR27933.1 hypothetical protein PHYPA_028525 [Physcomitrium patens]|eukprot:XP_024364626.1 F-box/kelch-repeat protein At5g15710-like [Physcomitrella patens]
MRKKARTAKAKSKDEFQGARASTSNDLCRYCTMDPKIWSLLPEDLTNRVLAWLPIPSLFQARSVCQRWSSTIVSSAFLSMHSEILCQHSPFLLFPSIGDSLLYAAFDPSGRKWQPMPPMSFLPSEVKFVEGVAGGLVFFSVEAHFQPVKLFVCNPLTRSWRQLPEMSYRRTPIIRHMVVDEATKTYKIVVSGNADVYSTRDGYSRYLNTEVYDSVTGLWTETGSMPSRFDPGWSSADCNGVLYCMVNEAEAVNHSLGVITYNMKDGQWSDHFQQLPEGFSLAQVVECGGQVLMVAERYFNGSVKNIHLLRLEVDTKEWTEIAKLPRKMLLEFRRLCEEESYNCAAHETKVYLTSFKGMHVLVYDVLQRTWEWTPKCPFFSDQADTRAVGFSYSPSFSVMV